MVQLKLSKIAHFSAETRHTKSQHKRNVFVVVDDHLKTTYYSNAHILKFSFLRSL